MEKKGSIVAILLNYNQNDYTIKCVNSLLDSNYEDLIIMLIDNGSTDKNFSDLQNFLPSDNKLIVKRLEQNIGYARGSNYGFEEALKLSPQYFLILNNDTIIDPDAISELVKTSKKYNDKARVTGKVYHYDQPNILQFISFSYKNKSMLTFFRFGVDELDTGQYDHLEEIEMMDDIFVLQPAKLYQDIGGYSPYLFINGVNLDISLRALKQGYKLVFSPNAKIWHKGSVSFGGRNRNPKLAYWNVQAKLITRFMHISKANFVIFYITICLEIFRTKIKSIIFKIFKKDDFSDYANAKYKALIYFHKWVKNKHINTGYNPF